MARMEVLISNMMSHLCYGTACCDLQQIESAEGWPQSKKVKGLEMENAHWCQLAVQMAFMAAIQVKWCSHLFLTGTVLWTQWELPCSIPTGTNECPIKNTVVLRRKIFEKYIQILCGVMATVIRSPDGTAVVCAGIKSVSTKRLCKAKQCGLLLTQLLPINACAVQNHIVVTMNEMISLCQLLFRVKWTYIRNNSYFFIR